MEKTVEKLDTTFNEKSYDLKLSANWEKLINNTDGSKKKVVMLNVNYTGSKIDIETRLEKLKNVLKRVERYKNIVLWFRLHPLNEESMQSSTPSYIYNFYISIITEYKHAGWGIYDDTNNFDRAVHYCDAYYGDKDSIIDLFQQQGKPVVIQSTGITSKKEH